MRTKRGAITLTIAVTAAIVAAIGTATLRAGPETPSASPATAKPAAQVPRVLFAHSVVLDFVPGGGAVTTSAYDSFEVLGPDGTRQSRAIAGVAVGTPVFDGRDRVAYWRRASIARSPLEFSGPSDVVVWDVRANQERLLLTLTDERSGGELLWSADGKSLVVLTRTPATGGARNRLILIDAASGAARDLHASTGDGGIGPLYADTQVVVGVRGSSYVVLDATSGAIRTHTPLRVPGSFMGESVDFASGSDGTVLELLHRFESDAGPLRIWNVRDPATDVAKVDERGISDPVFWPRRTEVVFTGPAGVAAVDYRSGRTRTLASPPGATFLVAVESGGRFALVRGDAGLQIVERVDDELRARPDLPLIGGLTLTPLGIVIP